MDNIRNVEKTLFSCIQSEYYKLDNILKKKKINKSLIQKINSINNDFLSIELKLKELRLSLVNEKNQNKEQIQEEFSNSMTEEDMSDIKDMQTLEKFKPLIFYYRMMLDA